MKTFFRVGLATSLVAAAGLIGNALPASADLGGPTPYEIEAKENYCADGGTRCVQPNQKPHWENLRFAIVEFYRITTPTGLQGRLGGPDGSLAPPEALIAKCAGRHWMDSRGNVHAITMSVFTGPADAGFDGGTLTGSVILRHALESSTRSEAVVAATGTDPRTGDQALVSGIQVANNVSDTLIRGAFNVSLRGPQYDEIAFGPDAQSATPVKLGNGTMTCNTGHIPVRLPGAPRPYFANEVNDIPEADS